VLPLKPIWCGPPYQLPVGPIGLSCLLVGQRARSGERQLGMETGLGDCHKLACVFIPPLELDGTNTVSDRMT
jgi:hypothetical protein